MPLHLFARAGLAGLLLVSACSGPSESKARKVALPAVAPPLELRGSAYEASAATPLPEATPQEHPDLHNVYRLSENIVSGSEPHGEEAFKLLHSMGVKTILSVDGKVPDQDMAAKYGMKYVHVPIQYKGIEDQELAEIAKTFREQEGPFFVHCFHGKHRGPAAAEIGRLVVDGISRETALAEMRQCGTSSSYEGLYATIAQADIPDEDETRALPFDFPAASPLKGVAGAMVGIARADDHLKWLSKNGWKPDPSHPDVDPVNEATKLTSLLERAQALPDVVSQPEDYRGWMKQAGVQSAELRDLLQQGASPDRVTAVYEALSKTCSACHKPYRN